MRKLLKKVKIITKIDKLGAGLSIASSDLSLRGAGNIIGAEQSGHIKRGWHRALLQNGSRIHQ